MKQFTLFHSPNEGFLRIMIVDNRYPFSEGNTIRIASVEEHDMLARHGTIITDIFCL